MSDGRGNWGRWGADDERGALNLLTPDVVLAAARTCKTGRVYNLGLPIHSGSTTPVPYRAAPQRLTLLDRTDDLMASFGAADGVGANEDVLLIASHNGTHMDALCHVFCDDALYNGFPSASFSTHAGASRCGIERLGGFAGRAVLLDLPAHQGVEHLEPGHVVSADELDACARAQDTPLRAADVALVRTGWLDLFLAQGPRAPFAQPGIGREAAEYLAAHDVAAVGADNTAVEAIPFDGGVFLTVHIELIVRRGIPLLENLDLRRMAADACHEGLFTAGPLLVRGATGSPVNPVVIG